MCGDRHAVGRGVEIEIPTRTRRKITTVQQIVDYVEEKAKS